MATKPKVGQIATTRPRFEEVDGDGHVFQGVNFYDDTPAPVAAPVVEDVSDDTELVAVISAAIAAAEGTSTDGFVVRSIKRRTSNKWNKWN